MLLIRDFRVVLPLFLSFFILVLWLADSFLKDEGWFFPSFLTLSLEFRENPGVSNQNGWDQPSLSLSASEDSTRLTMVPYRIKFKIGTSECERKEREPFGVLKFMGINDKCE